MLFVFTFDLSNEAYTQEQLLEPFSSRYVVAICIQKQPENTILSQKEQIMLPASNQIGIRFLLHDT